MDKKESKLKFGLGVYLNLGLAIVLAFVAVYLLVEIKTQARDQALLEAEEKAQLILDRNLATHTYFSHDLKPKVFELTDSYRSEDYFEPSWMSSTFAVREIDKIFKTLNKQNYYYKECAINARTPENEADEFEKKFIEELNVNPELQYRSLVREIDGEYYYVTLRRGEMMEESCLRCHSTPDAAPKNLVAIYGPERSFNRHVNETITAISIRVPLSDAYSKADENSRHLSMIFVAALLAIFVVQFLIHRVLILRPIILLKNKAISISNDEELLGEKIDLPASREFGELASAFNKMSMKLRYQIDNLEEQVGTRTAELTGANKNLQKALDEIKTITGIIPICMYCKGIRDDKGAWNKIEKYIAEHSDAKFSHGICEKCLKIHHPEAKI